MQFISGNVCAARGFLASGMHCGIRRNKSKLDLALIYSEQRAAAAAVYTQNLVKGAPLYVCKENLADGMAQAILCNSGNANTCNLDGIEVAQKMCALAGAALSISPKDVVVGSTGVIGQRLDISPIAAGIPHLAKALAPDGTDAMHAIMTTDTRDKGEAVEFQVGGASCRLGGIAKGSGMIHPNMATMLVYLTTDCAISPEMLQKALSKETETTFNMISVDGDTSTNDMVCVLANGMAGNPEIEKPGPEFDVFCEALNAVMRSLSRKIAADGEGASKLIECVAKGAKDWDTAKKVSKSVVCSSLTKAAMFGADANWGRVLCAIGYAGADVDVQKIDVRFRSAAGEILVCENGAGVDFSEEKAKEILLKDEITILVDLKDGAETATAFGCDLTYDYVKINGDYRT